MEKHVVVIGAGVAGISSAITLAKNNHSVILVSQMPSVRVQSVMAEGGVNAALDTMGENDCTEYHARETLSAGRFLADDKAVQDMTDAAPELLQELYRNGMSFQLTNDKRISLRNFGGQTKKRTAYTSASIGKQMMNTLSSMLRKYEASGLVERMDYWYFLKADIIDGSVQGCYLYNRDTDKVCYLAASQLIIASGGMNGLFGNATGSVLNSGDVTASLFASGVSVANGEMIQFHPTTVRLNSRNMLITEAARGEGGRLYALKDGKPYYFMEEKYPELGNLMPRDVIAREEYILNQQGYQVFLDLTELDADAYKRLDSVVSRCAKFLNIDVTREPIPVEPGIHYFMGGIMVDRKHRTNINGLYAAGECAAIYHGANRLGGNSLLGALYGGRIAAETAIIDDDICGKTSKVIPDMSQFKFQNNSEFDLNTYKLRLQTILRKALGICRDEETLREAIAEVECIIAETQGLNDPDAYLDENYNFHNECKLAIALLESAEFRKESRGAHYRADYPNESDEYRKLTVAKWQSDRVTVVFEDVKDRNENRDCY